MIVAKTRYRRSIYCSEQLHRPALTNCYVRLNAVLGHWGTLCSPLAQAFHGPRNGRPVDPTVYLKIFLVGNIEGVAYDTDLAERIRDSFASHDLIGYGSTERTPRHFPLGSLNFSRPHRGFRLYALNLCSAFREYVPFLGPTTCRQ